MVESQNERYSTRDAGHTLRNSRYDVRVARTMDDLLMVYSIRSAVYIAEQDCPFSEEFDGNDHCATHFIAFAADEPAGCLRARFFADFVKLERLAVRKPFRRSTLAFELVRCGINHARRKGFRRIYGHARQGLESFWARFGAKAIPGREEFLFSDHLYTEMTIDLEPADDEITLSEDPMKILRPEGDWDREGVLEFSRTRAARSVSSNSVRATPKPKNAA
ncbi:GNAT family N-acetyltransferase [Methylocystis bryophila]|uniref:GNAT family N-acetyltransferase n=1 Tax=Methylocystis bryophila TaxID=655015 RepID=A0A1W6N243_9HYPH|nr:GNAT family N-acetyltransferase [Methylocystis bryophila]ARN83831.1 GNAT family N-acetyltransferase [Methylocystis bryophila]